MKRESILLLDSFLNLVEWRGNDVHSWITDNYQEQPDYAYLKEMLYTVEEDKH